VRSAVGALLLVVIGSVIFASRRGYLDFEKFLEILYSETITCTFDICVGLGDVAAFTVSVVTYVALDNSLIQILPACWLFLSFAWLGSLYNAYHDAKQLYSVYFQHFKSTKFVDDMSFRNAGAIISKARGSGLEHTIAGKALTSHDVRNHLAQHVRLLSNERGKYEVLLELELATRELRRKRGDIITIMTESLPITAIQAYIMASGDETQIITIMVMFFSSVVFGAKVSSLGNYREVRERRELAEAAFKKMFHVFAVDRKGTGLSFEAEEAAELSAPPANEDVPGGATGGGGGPRCLARAESKHFLIKQYTEGGMLPPPACGALQAAVGFEEFSAGDAVEPFDEVPVVVSSAPLPGQVADGADGAGGAGGAAGVEPAGAAGARNDERV